MRVEGGSRYFLWPKEAGPQCHLQRVSCRSWHRPCCLLKVSELEISRLGRNLDQVSLGFEVCVWGGGAWFLMKEKGTSAWTGELGGWEQETASRAIYM